MRNRDYRFDEAVRSARPLSISVPPGGPVEALAGPEPLRFRSHSAVEARGLEASPVGLSVHANGGRVPQRRDPRTGRVSPSTPAPLDHTPPPQWSLAARPSRATRWGQNTGSLSASDWRDRLFYKRLIGLEFVLETTGIGRGLSPQVLPLAGEVSAPSGRRRGKSLLTHCGLPPPASGRLPLQGEDLAPLPFASKGAILKSHGETIAGLERSLKDRPPGGRFAAAKPSLTDLSRPARCSHQEI